MKIMVSACLLGENCKYNGGNNYNEKVMKYLKEHEVISVCPEVILQSRSPSCGVKQIYDGSFTGNKIEGQGIFAKLLKENNIKMMDVGDFICIIQ